MHVRRRRHIRRRAAVNCLVVCNTYILGCSSFSFCSGAKCERDASKREREIFSAKATKIMVSLQHGNETPNPRGEYFFYVCNIMRKKLNNADALFFEENEVNCMQMQKGRKSSFETGFLKFEHTPVWFFTTTFSTADVARLKYLCVRIFWGSHPQIRTRSAGEKPRVLHKKSERECWSG